MQVREQGRDVTTQDGRAARGLADAEAALIAAGASLVVGTVDPDGAPRATRAWAALVLDATAGRVRIVMSADDAQAVANVGRGAIAVTGADVRTLRAVQLKGRVERVGEPEVDDLTAFDEHASAFMEAVHEVDGNELSLLRRLLPQEVVVVDLVVDEVFDQSPGPGAGAVLDRTPGSGAS